MITFVSKPERRQELRHNADDVIRWKRPGRIEDRKVGRFDASPSGTRFLTLAEVAPHVGDELQLATAGGRDLGHDRAGPSASRADLTTNSEFVVVGCSDLFRGP